MAMRDNESLNETWAVDLSHFDDPARAEFPIALYAIEDGVSVPSVPGWRLANRHEELQLVVADAPLYADLLTETLELSLGDAIFINSGVIHRIRPQGKTASYASIMFAREALGFEAAGALGRTVRRILGNRASTHLLLRASESHDAVLSDALDRVLAAVRHLERERRDGSPQNRERAFLCAAAALLCLLAKIDEMAPQDVGRADTMRAARMQSYLECIERRFGERLSLEDIADAAHVSKSECLRDFKTAMDTTPYRYLIDYRVAVAARMLVEGDLPIGDIARSVGFSQTSRFSECFREVTGVSPRAYRAANAAS